MKSSDFYFYTLFVFIVGIIFYIYIRNNDDFQLKCVVSTVDGNKYCVRDRAKVKEAANLLAKVTKNCKDLVHYMHNKIPDDERTAPLVYSILAIA